MKKLLLLIIVLTSIIATPHTALADAGPIIYDAGGVITHDPKGISLEKEDLFITLNKKTCNNNDWEYYYGEYQVEAQFTFFNPNDPTNLEIFFPIPGDIVTDETLEYESEMSLIPHTFQMDFNGQSITDFEGRELDWDIEQGTLLDGYPYSFFTNLNFKNGINNMTF